MAARNRATSFVSPAPGATLGRTDQGVDWSNVRSIVAVAAGKITNVYPSLSGFGQTIIEKLQGGQSVYYAEETAGTHAVVSPGQSVAAGQQLAGGGSGGVIEAGFWDPSTGRSAGAPGYAEGQSTAAGRSFLNQIGANSPNTTIPSYVPAQFVPLVQSAAQQTGIPGPIVAAQAKAESGFNASAVSGAGAEGWLQFLPSTFKQYGKGSPFNPQDETGAYVNYMNSLLQTHNGNIRDALAEYNAGASNISAGYGYADSILAAAGMPRTVKAGSPSTFGGTRPGGGSGSGGDTSGQAVDKLFTDYETELNLPRTAPASTFSGSGWRAPFQYWWQSFSGQYAGGQSG